MAASLVTGIFTDPNTNTKSIVHVREVGAKQRPHMTCKFCKEKIHAKQGDVYDWHFAHSKEAQCDESPEKQASSMSTWHRDFQLACKPELIEVCIKNGNNVRMRADVYDHENGIVWEMQHSDLSCEKIMEREKFHIEMKLELQWVVDLTSHDDILQAKCQTLETGQPCYILRSNKKWTEHTTCKMFFDTVFGLFQVQRLLNGYYCGVLVDAATVFTHIQRPPCDEDSQCFTIKGQKTQYPWFKLKQPIKLLSSGLVYNAKAGEFSGPKDLSQELTLLLLKKMYFKIDYTRNVFVNRGMPKNEFKPEFCAKTKKSDRKQANAIRITEVVSSFIEKHEVVFGKTHFSKHIKIDTKCTFHAKLETMYERITEDITFEHDNYIMAGSCASYVFQKALSMIDDKITCSWKFNDIDFWTYDENGIDGAEYDSESVTKETYGDTNIEIIKSQKASTIGSLLKSFDLPCCKVGRTNGAWIIKPEAFYALITKENIMSRAPKAVILQCKISQDVPLLYNAVNAEAELNILESYRNDLHCSYADREKVKSLGARWNKKTKKWTAKDMIPLIEWIAGQQTKQNAELLRKVKICTYTDAREFWKAIYSLQDSNREVSTLYYSCVKEHRISVDDCKKLLTQFKDEEAKYVSNDGKHLWGKLTEDKFNFMDVEPILKIDKRCDNRMRKNKERGFMFK